MKNLEIEAEHANQHLEQKLLPKKSVVDGEEFNDDGDAKEKSVEKDEAEKDKEIQENIEKEEETETVAENKKDK